MVGKHQTFHSRDIRKVFWQKKYIRASHSFNTFSRPVVVRASLEQESWWCLFFKKNGWYFFDLWNYNLHIFFHFSKEQQSKPLQILIPTNLSCLDSILLSFGTLSLVCSSGSLLTARQDHKPFVLSYRLILPEWLFLLLRSPIESERRPLLIVLVRTKLSWYSRRYHFLHHHPFPQYVCLFFSSSFTPDSSPS